MTEGIIKGTPDGTTDTYYPSKERLTELFLVLIASVVFVLFVVVATI